MSARFHFAISLADQRLALCRVLHLTRLHDRYCRLVEIIQLFEIILIDFDDFSRLSDHAIFKVC